MTANISVHIAEAKGVWAVTSAAFRFKPPASSADGVPAAGPAPTPSPAATKDGKDARKALYLLGEDGQPEKVMVEVGLNDGNFTEIKSPTDFADRVAVLGVNAAPPKGLTGQTAGGSNPFMPRPPNAKKPNVGPKAP